jgi:hypothetical protein
MKKEAIEIGAVYTAKVTGRIVPIQILAENPHGGWDGVNQSTNKKVRIKSAQRLRHRWTEPKALKEKKAATPNADAAPSGKTDPKATKDAKPAQSHDTGEPCRPECDKPRSLLEVAAYLLSLGTGQPMRCKDLVDLAIKRNLWSPRSGGKTPANTLHAAIQREINTRGAASRFAKAERGHFALASKE